MKKSMAMYIEVKLPKTKDKEVVLKTEKKNRYSCRGTIDKSSVHFMSGIRLAKRVGVTSLKN